MTRSLQEIIDYIDYANGRGQSFPYVDFAAGDLKRPQVSRSGAVIFPESWDERRRETWRRKHNLTVPDEVRRAEQPVRSDVLFD